MKKLSNTLSFWLTLAGAAALTSQKTRTAGGWALLVAGLGGVGAGWERACGCKLNQLHWDKKAAVGAVCHLPQVALGAAVLSRRP